MKANKINNAVLAASLGVLIALPVGLLGGVKIVHSNIQLPPWIKRPDHRHIIWLRQTRLKQAIMESCKKEFRVKSLRDIGRCYRIASEAKQFIAEKGTEK